jgi:hypothetical protein
VFKNLVHEDTQVGVPCGRLFDLVNI